MRQFATGLNRTWLAVIGVFLLLGGLGATAVGTDLLASVTSSGPAKGDRLIGAGAAAVFAGTGAVVGVLLVALVIALLGLGWLIAQVPRTNAASVFRLEDDAMTGLTSVSPSVLTDAVSAQLATLPGVTAADAVLRGTADQPELTVRLTANDRTDVPALLRRVRTGPVGDLATAMGAPLTRLAIQVDISAERRSSDSVTF